MKFIIDNSKLQKKIITIHFKYIPNNNPISLVFFIYDWGTLDL